jgi:hypothetical protein
MSAALPGQLYIQATKLSSLTEIIGDQVQLLFSCFIREKRIHSLPAPHLIQ